MTFHQLISSPNTVLVTVLGAAAAIGLAATVGPAAAQSNAHVEVGVLNCQVAGATSFIVGSTKSLSCTFNRADGLRERYAGTIQRFGIDIGQTSQSVIAWGVFAPSSSIPNGALAGSYGGVSGEATIGVGLGANVLVGGSNSTIALQPLSVQAQQGLSIAAGIAALELHSTR